VIVEVSGEGRNPRVAVKSGDGPGEVRGPYSFVRWPDDVFGVYDAQHSSFELYSRTGKFIRRMLLDSRVSNIKGMAALPGRGVVVSGGIAGNKFAIHVFDSTGTLKSSTYPVPATRNPRAGVMVAGGALAIEPSGVAWFSQSAPHFIGRSALAGGSVERFAADSTLLAPIGDDFIHEETVDGRLVRTFKWFFPQSRAIIPLGQRLLNIIVRYDDDESIWELYDVPSKRRLTITRVPRAYHVLGTARNGDFIASRDEKSSGQALLCRLRLSSP
jgi:hypothetical protein